MFHVNHLSVEDQTVYIDQDYKIADKGHDCDDCVLHFDSVHDLQRHIKRRWCTENNDPPAKRM
jgi:hypothetical protein